MVCKTPITARSTLSSFLDLVGLTTSNVSNGPMQRSAATKMSISLLAPAAAKYGAGNHTKYKIAVTVVANAKLIVRWMAAAFQRFIASFRVDWFCRAFLTLLIASCFVA